MTKLLYIAAMCLVGTAAQSQCLPKGWKPPLPGRVLVLRPRVKLSVVKAFTDGQSEATVGVISDDLLAMVAHAFEDRKYRLVVEPLLMDDWEKDASTMRAVSAFDDEYDLQISGDANRVCKDQFKVMFGQYVQAMPNHSETDLLVLIRGTGSVLTKGGKMTSVLGLGYGPYDYLAFGLGIIDGPTGHLVYSCNGHFEGSEYINQPLKLSGPIKTCLQMFFEGSPQRRHRWIRFQFP